jgi:hypothetical protein
MKDLRHRSVQTRNGIASAVAVAAIAVVVVVGPHLLRTSPTTNDSTDPANGVRTTGVASQPRCRSGTAPVSVSLRGDLHLAAATVCAASRRGGRLVLRGPSVPLDAGQLRELEADFNAHSTSAPRIHRTCRVSRGSTVVAAVTVDGQAVQLASDGCTGEFAGAGRYWVPSALTRATLRSAVRR